MTLIAFSGRDKFDRLTTNVVSADTKENFNQWTDKVTAAYVKNGGVPTSNDLFEAYRVSNLIDSMQNPDLKGLKYVKIFSHYDKTQQEKFIKQNDIEITNKKKCQEYQDIMYNGHQDDTFLREEDEYVKLDENDGSGGKITIADIIGEPLKKKEPTGDISAALNNNSAKPKDTTSVDSTDTKGTIGGQDSIIGVVDVRRDADMQNTNIVASYRPKRLKAVAIDTESVKVQKELDVATDGQYCFSGAGPFIYAVPPNFEEVLSKLFPNEEIKEILWKDYQWEYDYLKNKQETKNQEVEDTLTEIQQANQQGILDTLTKSAGPLTDFSETVLKTAEKIAAIYGDIVPVSIWQNAIARATSESEDAAEILVKTRDILNEYIRGPLENIEAEDNEDVYSLVGEKSSELGVKVDHLPIDIANWLIAHGHKDHYVSCYDYPVDAIVNGNIVIPISTERSRDVEVPITYNARLCSSVEYMGTLTKIFRLRDKNSPAYIVMYFPGNLHRFSLFRITRQ